MTTWISTRKVISDGTSLFIMVMKQWQRSKPNKKISFKDIILNEARQNQNRVATSMLSIDREIGLMKYHGIPNYLRQYSSLRFIKFPSLGMFPSSPSGDDVSRPSASPKSSLNASSATTPTPPKAKVAFMITAAQRSQLIEMGYTASQIKKLKPIEALLILENQLIPPSTCESESDEGKSKLQKEIQKLVDEYEDEQRLHAEQVLAKAEAEAVADPLTTSTLNEKDDEAKSQNDEKVEINNENQTDSTSHSITTSLNSIEPSKDEKQIEWFEVVEIINDETNETNEGLPINSKSTTSVIGLFKSEEEANFCREIKEEMENRRQKDSNRKQKKRTFFIQPKNAL